MLKEERLKKSAARVWSVNIAYMNMISPDDNYVAFIEETISSGGWDDDIENTRPDMQFIQNAINNIQEKKENIDEMIVKYMSDRWTLDRINRVTYAILQTAICEIIEYPDTPLKVIISEYLKITDQLVEEKDAKFVHAVLDKSGKKVREIECQSLA